MEPVYICTLFYDQLNDFIRTQFGQNNLFARTKFVSNLKLKLFLDPIQMQTKMELKISLLLVKYIFSHIKILSFLSYNKSLHIKIIIFYLVKYVF